jgi:hypothetical protein
MAKKGEPISKDEFKKMKDKYDKKNPGKTKAVTFDQDTFKRIMDNPETVDIAVYFGEDDEDKNTVMLVGIDKNGAIMYDTAQNKGSACPPYCPTA